MGYPPQGTGYPSSGGVIGPPTGAAVLEAPTQASDAAAQVIRLISGSGYPQATVNTTGANLDLVPGTGRRFFTAVSNVAGAVVLTFTIDGTATTLTSGTDFTLGSDDTAPQLAVTATNLAAAVNANVTISAGVSAVASTSKVYLTKLVGTRTVTIATNQAGRISTTSGADGVIAPWGAITIPAGLGAVSQIVGPSDADLTLSSNAAKDIHLSPRDAYSVLLSTNLVAFASGVRLGWSSTSTPSGGDAGIVRASAGILKITGATGTSYGSLRAEWPRRTFGVNKTPGTAATLTAWGGAPTHTLTGTASNVSDSTGHYVQLSGDAAIAGIDIAATECCKTEVGPIFTAVIKTGALLPTEGTERIWVGVSSASLAATDSPTGAHVAAFRYAIDSDGTLFWRAVTNDGGADTGTVTVGTVAIAAATRYVLTIDMTNSASITFYVNGALIATHATNLPTVTTAMGTQCFALDAGAWTMELLISEIRFETN